MKYWKKEEKKQNGFWWKKRKSIVSDNNRLQWGSKCSYTIGSLTTGARTEQQKYTKTQFFNEFPFRPIDSGIFQSQCHWSFCLHKFSLLFFGLGKNLFTFKGFVTLLSQCLWDFRTCHPMAGFTNRVLASKGAYGKHSWQIPINVQMKIFLDVSYEVRTVCNFINKFLCTFRKDFAMQHNVEATKESFVDRIECFCSTAKCGLR